MTIARKLLLSLLGLTLVVVLVTLTLSRLSFERGLRDYGHALELSRLQAVAENLSSNYQMAGNRWSELTEHRFQQLSHDAYPVQLDRERPDGGDHGPRDMQHPRPGHRPADPPTALFDAGGQQIAGEPLPDRKRGAISVPVMVAGVRAGELRSVPPRRQDSPQAAEFSRYQLISSLFVGGVALALATFVAFLLTRVLLAPLRQLQSGVAELSHGNFAYRLHDTRQDELGQLMANLDLLAKTLEENRSSRQRWLADISHELRTPVTVLTGELEGIKDGIRPLEMSQILSLDQEVSRLRRLIDDLYDLSLSDIGGLRYLFAPMDVGQLVGSVVESLTRQAADAGLKLCLTGIPGHQVNADSRRLEQLFANLIGNSIAYTEAPGQIQISVASNGSRRTVVIEDSPPGVVGDECARLFEPLYRQDSSRSRRVAGAGLGLAICKNIVDAHQGSITASSSALGGLRVVVELPAYNEADRG